MKYALNLLLFFVYMAILSVGLVDLCFQTCVAGDIVNASIWKPIEINWLLFDSTMALGGIAGIWRSIAGVYEFFKERETL